MSLKSNVIVDGYSATLNTASGAATITAPQLFNGYIYSPTVNNAAAAALTLPASAAVFTYLDQIGVLPPAGSRAGFVLPNRLIVNNAAANNLTLTPAAGDVNTTIVTPVVNAESVVYNVVLTSDNTIKLL
jgi:hypothetical protein